MSANTGFRPTLTERRKYADYRVERREALRPVDIGSDGGGEIRVFVDFFRIPSARTFRWRPRLGATPAELIVAERWATRLPEGWWAKFPNAWFKHRFVNDHRWYWYQGAGFSLDSEARSFEQWELELAEPSLLLLAA